MSNIITQLCRPLKMAASEKAALMALADAADDAGAVWVGMSLGAIERWTCLAHTTVARAVRALEGMGFLKVSRPGNGKRTGMALDLDKLRQCSAGSKTSSATLPVRVEQRDQTSSATLPVPAKSSSATLPVQASAQVAQRQATSSAALPEPVAPRYSITYTEEREDRSPSANLSAKGAAGPVGKEAKREKAPAITAGVWDSYSVAWTARYGTSPLRNATVNGQLATLVKQLGADEAARVAGYYVAHQDALYVRAAHPVGLLLRDAQRLRMEWATGRRTGSATRGSLAGITHGKTGDAI